MCLYIITTLGTKEPTADTVGKDLAKSPTSGAETLGMSSVFRKLFTYGTISFPL